MGLAAVGQHPQRKSEALPGPTDHVGRRDADAVVEHVRSPLAATAHHAIRTPDAHAVRVLDRDEDQRQLTVTGPAERDDEVRHGGVGDLALAARPPTRRPPAARPSARRHRRHRRRIHEPIAARRGEREPEQASVGHGGEGLGRDPSATSSCYAIASLSLRRLSSTVARETAHALDVLGREQVVDEPLVVAGGARGGWLVDRGHGLIVPRGARRPRAFPGLANGQEHDAYRLVACRAPCA
jgi:hypothetical protein